MKKELERRLRFVDFATIHFISALHGTGVGNLYKSIEEAYQSATDKFSTNYLTRILEDAVREHQPPMIQGRRIKLRYAHPGGHNPPIVVIHGNQTADIPSHYTKYLEKTFRRVMDLHGTPIRIEYCTTDNPYAEKKKKVTQREFIKKRRLENAHPNKK